MIGGFTNRFLAEVGHEALAPLRYVSQRDRDRPASRRPRYRGALRPWPATDPETGEKHPFRVLYVWSSEEADSVAAGRERALTKAEEELAKVRRGLGGRYYKTAKQVEAKLATILTPSVHDILSVRVADRDGTPPLSWRRNLRAIAQLARTDGIYALATNLPGRLNSSRVLRIYKQ